MPSINLDDRDSRIFTKQKTRPRFTNVRNVARDILDTSQTFWTIINIVDLLRAKTNVIEVL